MTAPASSNFSVLAAHDEQFVRLGRLAERYFADDPNTCLLKLRQLAEGLAQSIASRVGLFTTPDEKQADLLRRLQDHGIVPREVGALFHEVRRAGNDANHKLADDHRTALMALRFAWQLSVWFHRTFKEAGFKSGPFLPPAPPANEGAELKVELDTIRSELAAFRAAHQGTAQALEATKAQAQQTEEERAFWEAMAADAEAAKHEMAQRLAALQAKASTQPAQAVDKLVAAANSAAATIQLSEADTRKLVDEQLLAAGWTADSTVLTFNKGARPQKNKAMAIAEWPRNRAGRLRSVHRHEPGGGGRGQTQERGRACPSVICIGPAKLERAKRSIEIDGLNLGNLITARKRVMRDVQDDYHTLMEICQAGCDMEAVNRLRVKLRRATLPDAPYARAARAKIQSLLPYGLPMGCSSAHNQKTSWQAYVEG